LLLNNRGEKFLDSEFLLGVEPRQIPYTPWFVMDCTNHDVLGPLGKVACEGQTQKVTISVPKASRSSVIFDLDNDGDLDIVTNDLNSEPMVLISDLAQQKKIHWLKLVLVGPNPIAMAWAPPFACTPTGKPTLATTTASLATCHKVFYPSILVLVIAQK